MLTVEAEVPDHIHFLEMSINTACYLFASESSDKHIQTLRSRVETAVMQQLKFRKKGTLDSKEKMYDIYDIIF